MSFTFNNRELIVNVNIEEVKEAGGLDSAPPIGKYTVTNLFVEPSTGRLTVEYDDTPAE